MKKWNYETKKYEECTVPNSWKVKVFNVDLYDKVNCVECGKLIKYGDGYPSTTIHNKDGFGYVVCQECHYKEMKKEFMTFKQLNFIKAMNEFCKEKFDLSYPRTKEEAMEYISRNFKEYKMQSTIDDNWNARNGEF